MTDFSITKVPSSDVLAARVKTLEAKKRLCAELNGKIPFFLGGIVLSLKQQSY